MTLCRKFTMAALVLLGLLFVSLVLASLAMGYSPLTLVATIAWEVFQLIPDND